MGRPAVKSKDHTAHAPGDKSRQSFVLAWRSFFLAAVPIGLSVYYLSWVAPSLVPVPPGLHVPMPDATRFLERVCTWCGEHRREVVVIALVLLFPGVLYRSTARRERYLLRLAIVVSLALGFAYLNISSPIDRLDKAVDEAIPVDERVPSHAAEE